MKNTRGKKKVGVVVVATGRYILFVEQLYKSIRKYFLKNHDVTVFVFTDNITKAPAGTVPLFQKQFYWPGASMKRYYVFLKYRAILEKMDYLYYMDADMTIAKEICDDILGDLVGTLQPEEVGHPTNGLPYDRNPKSLAYIPAGEGKKYYCGGFNGGTAKAFLSMAETLRDNIEEDLENKIVARCYDESHLNRYFASTPPAVTLDASYCWIKAIKAEPHIIAIVKDHVYYRQSGADAKVEKTGRPRITFLNYSNAKYRDHQQRLCVALSASGINDVVAVNYEAIVGGEFWQRHETILSMERGGGYWLWKPYLIIETMKHLKEGEILCYMDSGDMFRPGSRFVEFIEEKCVKNGALIVQNSGTMKQWCKRDTFILTNCDTAEYYNMNQVEAGGIGLIKNDKTMLLLEEWFRYCQNPMIITDEKSTQGQSFPEFQDHRHDQAVLSLMVKAHGFKTVPIGTVASYFIFNFNGTIDSRDSNTLPPARKEAAAEQRWEKRLSEMGLPPDMSENHPDYRIPSRRNRYNLLKKEFENK